LPQPQRLELAVKQGTFRKTLLRLNVIRLSFLLAGALIRYALLTRHFIEKFNAETKRAIKGISPEALNCFTQYDWPGNVRELETD